MSTLFVDCDDTLVLWLNDGKPTSGVLLPEAHPYGAGADRWVKNAALVEAIEARRSEFDTVVVWTGGGQQYAERWRNLLLPWADHAIAKDTRIPLATDLCIDDMALGVRAPQQTWQEFIAPEPTKDVQDA